MAFSNDKQIVESILYDISGSALALINSSSVDLNNQPGLMLAALHSSSGGGYRTKLLTVDDQGRLYVNAEIVPAGVQTVTGSIFVEQPIAITDNGGSLTVDGLVTANVTGTVNLDRGNSTSLPLFVSGTVGIGGPVSVVGSVTSVVTGTVNLDRGNDVNNPIWTSGSTTINNFPAIQTVTGSVGITTTVKTSEEILTNASGTYTPANTSTVVVASLNANRRNVIMYNNSNKAVYVKFGTGASSTDFTVKIFADDKWDVNTRYSGVITAQWAGVGTSGLFITEITP